MGAIRATGLLKRILKPELVTIQEIATRLNISYGSARKVIQGDAFGKNVANQVLAILTPGGYKPNQLLQFDYEPRFRRTGGPALYPRVQWGDTSSPPHRRHIRRKPAHPTRRLPQ
jgi:hypothetical protein